MALQAQPAGRERPAPKPIASGLAFSALCAVRNTEAHLRWLGAQLSVFLNIPGIGGAAFRLIVGPGWLELLVIGVGSAILVGANIFLYFIIQRDGKLLGLWNDKADELETVNGIEGGVQIFSSRRYRRLAASRHRLQRRLEWAMVACIVMWGAIATIAITLFLMKIGGR
jgi:hypothetical protein